MVSATSTSYAEVFAYLTLYHLPKLGLLRLKASASRLGCSIKDLTSMSPSSLYRIGWNANQVEQILRPQSKVKQQARDTMKWLSKSESHHFISLADERYPPLLKELHSPPLFLYGHGNSNLLKHEKIAMVGSRFPSHYGMQVTKEFVQGLPINCNIVTVSGLALGIDSICHKTSIACGVPTIAVLGNGIDITYPKRNNTLSRDIAVHGLILSEYPLGTQPHPKLFPRRNRIISGLSQGIIVVEAKQKSGSLITAKYALEQNREVFSVPSNIYSDNGAGSNGLIKDGAQLVDSIAEVMHTLNFACDNAKITPQQTRLALETEKNSKERLAMLPLLDSVDYTPTPVDQIVSRSNMAVHVVLTELLDLELQGHIASCAEGYVRVKG